MDNVVRYERVQTSRWLAAFFAALVIIVLGLMYVGWTVYVTGVSMRTWDLVGLFVEDALTISEFWQDTLSVVMYEVSPVTLLILLVLIASIISLFLRTQKKRRIITRVRTELAKHGKNRNNVPYGKESV